jgi:hypothetical protein
MYWCIGFFPSVCFLRSHEDDNAWDLFRVAQTQEKVSDSSQTEHEPGSFAAVRHAAGPGLFGSGVRLDGVTRGVQGSFPILRPQHLRGIKKRFGIAAMAVAKRKVPVTGGSSVGQRFPRAIQGGFGFMPSGGDLGSLTTWLTKSACFGLWFSLAILVLGFRCA